MTDREQITVMAFVTLYIYTVGFGYFWLGSRWEHRASPIENIQMNFTIPFKGTIHDPA